MKKLSVSLLALFLCIVSVFGQTTTENFVETAKQFDHEGKFNEAVAEISKAIAAQPNNADLYITRANYNLLLEKKSEVLSDAQKAVSLAPTDKKILYFSALVLRKSQQYEEALKISDSHIALGDADRFAWYLRIGIKTQLRDLIGAFEDATAAAELFPQDNTFKQNQASLIRLTGDSDKALEMYNSRIASLEIKTNKAKDESTKRDLSSLLFSRADLYFSKLNNEAAKSDLLKAVSYLPTEFTYLLRAKVYKQQKMYPEAVADLTKALEINKQQEKIIFLIERGDLYYLMQKYSEAISDYEEILKLDDGQLKDLMQRRISLSLAQQKMKENGIQPK
jgi:tetratricopeptide (TPR) repeat protein